MKTRRYHLHDAKHRKALTRKTCDGTSARRPMNPTNQSRNTANHFSSVPISYETNHIAVAKQQTLEMCTISILPIFRPKVKPNNYRELVHTTVQNRSRQSDLIAPVGWVPMQHARDANRSNPPRETQNDGLVRALGSAKNAFVN